ncbi:uncharacterized protein JCM6883_007179 [Sporobolomyces salmoneus]|uniref:uncharacterized protein n=1 Tax=Sporobolomyces salmoneus TaxID=183962 RepID=UPI003181648D
MANSLPTLNNPPKIHSASYTFASTTLLTISRAEHNFPAQKPSVETLLTWTASKRIDFRLFELCTKIIKRAQELSQLMQEQATANSRTSSPMPDKELRRIEKELLDALEVEGSEGFHYLCDHNWKIIFKALSRVNIFNGGVDGRGRIVSRWNARDFMEKLRSPGGLRGMLSGAGRLVNPIEARIKELSILYKRIENRKQRRLSKPFTEDWMERVSSRLEHEYEVNHTLLLEFKSWLGIEDGLWIAAHDLNSIILEHRRVGYRQIAIRPDLRTFGLARDGGYLI